MWRRRENQTPKEKKQLKDFVVSEGSATCTNAKGVEQCLKRYRDFKRLSLQGKRITLGSIPKGVISTLLLKHEILESVVFGEGLEIDAQFAQEVVACFTNPSLKNIEIKLKRVSPRVSDILSGALRKAECVVECRSKDWSVWRTCLPHMGLTEELRCTIDNNRTPLLQTDGTSLWGALLFRQPTISIKHLHLGFTATKVNMGMAIARIIPHCIKVFDLILDITLPARDERNKLVQVSLGLSVSELLTNPRFEQDQFKGERIDLHMPMLSSDAAIQALRVGVGKRKAGNIRYWESLLLGTTSLVANKLLIGEIVKQNHYSKAAYLNLKNSTIHEKVANQIYLVADRFTHYRFFVPDFPEPERLKKKDKKKFIILLSNKKAKYGIK